MNYKMVLKLLENTLHGIERINSNPYSRLYDSAISIFRKVTCLKNFRSSFVKARMNVMDRNISGQEISLPNFFV